MGSEVVLSTLLLYSVGVAPVRGALNLTQPIASSRLGTGTSSDWNYCTNSAPCRPGQGDCDTDGQCEGETRCGTDNCQDYNKEADPKADCCYSIGTGTGKDWSHCTSNVCTLGQGDCDKDSECAGSLVCGKDNCREFHPHARSSADCCEKAPVTTNTWTKLPSVDCYAGKGGDPILPDPFSSSITLAACKIACASDPSCEGIIRKASDGESRGICYKRKNLVLSNCVNDPVWDLHKKPTTGGGGTTTTTRRPPSTRYGCKYGIQSYPRRLPNSRYYKKLCTTHNNLKVISSNRASDAALERTAFLIGHVMAYVDPRVAPMMNAKKFRHAVMAASEVTTNIPEHAWLGAYWDTRARGLGATVGLPVGSSAEENALCYPNDRYKGEDITIHEFAHSMHLTGFALVFPSFNRELKALYNAAKYRGLWGARHYAMTDFKEYFAEGVQSYFDANAADYYAPTNRYELWQKDRKFYDFLYKYLGDNSWKRTC